MIAKANVVVLENPAALAQRAADEFVRRALTALAERGTFSVALSGGTTPTAMFELLASPRFATRVPWEHVHVFWSDERCVPPDDPASNFGLAQRTLLSRVDIPATNVHRMKGELPPEQAARDYQNELAEFFEHGLMHLDLVLLGLGPDGHTASLFPRTAALSVTDTWCVANRVADAPVSPWRLTLTFPSINAARAAMFLVEGDQKADIVAKVLEGPRDVTNLPAQGVTPADGELMWLLDRPAASRLRR